MKFRKLIKSRKWNKKRKRMVEEMTKVKNVIIDFKMLQDTLTAGEGLK